MFSDIFKNIGNTINESKFLSIICASIVIFIAIRVAIYVIQLFGDYRSYIVNKSRSLYLSNQKNTNLDNASLSMPDRIEFTNSVLDLISFMVNNEIISYMKPYVALNNTYDISNLDTDVEKVSTIVFNGININLFKDPNLILTEKYLMEYITKKTINVMLDIVQNHNAILRGQNQGTED